MTTINLRIIKSKRDIQTGFMGLLQTKPFREITVNDICQTALVGRSTFYRHYVDKYALLEAIVATQTRHFDDLLTQRLTALEYDTGLVALYQDLTADRQTILTLFAIHEPQADLSAAFFNSLKHHIEPLLQQFSFTVPTTFIVELYATNALTAIRWSLENGQVTDIATFMNDLLKPLLIKYRA